MPLNKNLTPSAQKSQKFCMQFNSFFFMQNFCGFCLLYYLKKKEFKFVIWMTSLGPCFAKNKTNIRTGHTRANHRATSPSLLDPDNLLRFPLFHLFSAFCVHSVTAPVMSITPFIWPTGDFASQGHEPQPSLWQYLRTEWVTPPRQEVARSKHART